jgi:glycosyltransferase involved in cell wall biosynthesis
MKPDQTMMDITGSRDKSLHICLVSVEIFAWGKFGGFGKATRLLGRELVKRGYRVSALIPRRKPQNKVAVLDGITVYGYDLRHPRETMQLFKDCDADIFHSQEPNLGTYLVQRFHPGKKHIVTFRDTRLISDWLIEFFYPSRSHSQVLANILFEDNFLVHKAVREADARFTASYILIGRAEKKYHLKEKPLFLPTPVQIPVVVKKSTTPTVCYVSRWDRRKRPELLIALAKAFPDVQFIAVGASRDPKYDQRIRTQLLELPNVEVHGMINQFEGDELAGIFSRSWILLNTAAREGLPNSYIEACAHECAILSAVDPDGFATKFGYHAQKDDFPNGLNYLLKNDEWHSRGIMGAEYVMKTFGLETAVQKHIQIYRSLVNPTQE